MNHNKRRQELKVGDILISKVPIHYWIAEDVLESVPAGTEFVYRGEVEENPGFVRAQIGAANLHVEECKFK